MNAYVLCENCVYRNTPQTTEQEWYLTAEHGWSVFLETKDGNFLFDTGAGPSIVNNAAILGLNLPSIQGIILSHNHNDHTGGLLPVLQSIKKNVPVYTHPDLFVKSCTEYAGSRVYSGIRYDKQLLEANGANFRYNKNTIEIVPDIYLTGEIPRTNEFEKGDVNLLMEEDGLLLSDPIKSDQALVIKTQKGLFVILGCAHSGIINTLEYAIEITGVERIHTVIGGTHLAPTSEEQKTETMKALKKYNIERLGVSHCTGLDATVQLKKEFGDKMIDCNVSSVIEY